jgi:CRP-like cAMP-binding protein
VPFLAVLPPHELESLAAQASPLAVGAGRNVFAQGEAGERFYVIEAGTAAVTSDGRPLPTLGPGDCFGEIALLRDVPRTATVTALTDLTLLVVERDPFLAVVAGDAPSADAAGALVQARLGRTVSQVPV